MGAVVTKRRGSTVVGGVVAIALLATLIALASRWPAWGQDEGTYTDQAVAVLNGRISWYTYWYDHPPVGWMLLAPFIGVLKLFGFDYMTAARIVSAVCLIISSMLVYGISYRITARRYLSLLAPALLLTGALTWTSGRMVFLDVYALPLFLGSIFLFLDSKKRLWHYAIAGILFAVSVLCKETFLLFLPGILYLAWQRLSEYDPERRRILRPFAFTAALTTIVLLVGSYPVFAMMRGELLPGEGHVSLWDAVMFQLVDRDGSGRVWEAGSVKQELWLSWIHADPILLLSLAASVLLVFVRQWRWLPIAVAGFALPALIGNGYVPVMHIIALLPLAALAWVAYAETGWRLLSRTSIKPLHVGYASALIAISAIALPVRSMAVMDDTDLDANDNINTALAWVSENTSPDANILADGSMIVQIYEMGYEINVDPLTHGVSPQSYVVAHEKLDRDPEVAQKFDNGCDIDYVLLTGQIKADIESLGLSNVTEVLARSTSVWHNDAVDIRKAVTPCR